MEIKVGGNIYSTTEKLTVDEAVSRFMKQFPLATKSKVVKVVKSLIPKENGNKSNNFEPKVAESDKTDSKVGSKRTEKK